MEGRTAPEAGTRALPALAGLFALALVFSPAQPAVALERTEAIEEIRRQMLRQLRGEDVAGAAIVLVAGGEVIWKQAWGDAERDTGRALTDRTPMLVGDLTKLVTAIAVLQLAEAGEVELDAPVSAYLPELALSSPEPGWPAPTLRQLLTHHGGFPANRFAGSFRTEPAGDAVDLGELELAQRPGRIYAYSQIGYQVAGKVVEEITGMPYAKHAREAVLEPLGLADAGFGALPGLARPHDRRERQQPVAWPRDVAALGLAASISDLGEAMRWMLSEDTAPLLGRSWVDTMTTVQNADVDLDLDNRTAIAFQMTNTGGHNVERVLRMNSVIIQHRAVLLLAPDHGIGVAVIANSSAAGDLVREISQLAMDALLQAEAGLARPDEETRLPDTLELPRGAQPAPMAKRYSTPLGEIALEGEDPAWDVDFLGKPFRAKRREDGWYKVAYRLLRTIDLRFSFLAEILVRPVVMDGEALLLAHYRGSNLLLGTALGAGGDLGDAARWTGRYRIANPGLLSEALELEEAEVVIEDGRLYLSYELPSTIRLTPRMPLVRIDEGRFRVPGLGVNTGQTVRFDRLDGQRRLRIYGWELLELR